MDNEVFFGDPYVYGAIIDDWFETNGNWLLGLIIAFGVIMLAVCVMMVISLWKVYTKAGEKGWASLIPFYTDYVMYRITWGEGLNFLYQFVSLPIVPTVVRIITNIKLARSFGKGDGFAVGLILVPVVFYPILAFGKSEYIAPVKSLSEVG